ncbi:MAG: TolC family protein [Planctomycetota bacterium]
MRSSPTCTGLVLLAAAGPALTPPAAATPSAVRPGPTQEAGSRAAPGAPEAVEPPAFELFLEEALGLATRNNLGLERASIESEIARYETVSAYGAFDWIFDVRGSYSDSEIEGATFLSGGSVVNTEQFRVDVDITRPLTWGGSFNLHFDTQQSKTDNELFNAPEQFEDNLRVSYVQPLLRGFGYDETLEPVRRARIAEKQRDEDRRSARQTLLRDVEVAYWELVAAGEQLDVAQSALTLGFSQVEREEARLRAGDGTEVDILQARADVAMRQEALLQAQNDVAAREDDLKRLMFNDGDPTRWDTPITVRTELPEARDATGALDVHWMDAYQVAVQRRPDLRNARHDVDAARLAWGRARSERLHGLDLELGASSNGVDTEFQGAFRDASEFRFPTISAAIAYNMPLQNRAASGAEQSARARLRASQVALDESELAALAEIRGALREVRFRAQAVVAAEQSLELAERQLEAERRRFEAELSTTFQVLEFQQTMIESRSTRIRARVEYAKARAALALSLGSTGERSGLLPVRTR